MFHTDAIAPSTSHLRNRGVVDTNARCQIDAQPIDRVFRISLSWLQ